MSQIAESGEDLSDVNVIPLADLSLVLLIILMIMTPMISQALIQVSAKEARAAQDLSDLKVANETPIIVSFEPGALKLNGTIMGSDLEFFTRLGTVLQRRQDKSVLFTASPDMLHGKVVHVMDMIKRLTDELVMLRWKRESAFEGNEV